MEKLEDIRKLLAAVPNIDLGGCGIAALIMYRWIEKNDPENIPTIVYLYPYTGLYRHNTRIMTLGGIPEACFHTCILYKGQYIDSDEIIDVSAYKHNHHIKDIEFVEKSINNVSDWNKLFDRKWVNLISYKLNIDLSDISTDKKYKEKYYREVNLVKRLKFEFINFFKR